MARATFPLFPSLPAELRQEIYKLATPPRIVHVQESPEDRETFRLNFAKRFFRLKLSPSLTHFACCWRDRIPFGGRQPTLEYFGFSGPPAFTPWLPSESTPEIPLNWLGEHPEVAWELTRKGKLYSRAPTPALLHTCSESRATLIRLGYELAFSTRSSGPGTWFNFDADILYLEQHPVRNASDESATLLSGWPWHIGQFDPKDLLRVRKLALEDSARCLDPSFEERRNRNIYSNALSTIIRLFGHLEKVLLVEWTGKDVNQRRQNSTPEDCVSWDIEPWDCVRVEEVDALLPLFLLNSKRPRFLSGADKHGDGFRRHKTQNGPNAELFEDLTLALRKQLKKDRTRAQRRAQRKFKERLRSWRVPELLAVHIMPPSQLEILGAERRRLMEDFVQLKADICTDQREHEVLTRWLSKWKAEEQTFEPSESEMETFARWIEEDGALDELELEEEELANWADPEGPWVEGLARSWWDDYEAEKDVRCDWEQSVCYQHSDFQDDPSRSAERREWWIQNGWFRALDDPNLELWLNCQLEVI